ncbi:MAG: ribonucleoside-diphosphate reductase, adenosylcobalamin-dependent, partial [Candidatus Methanomethylophilaceae archaeon]|nr:ribonucleoside-diphosphate reductase, adenosylcobalamin-dependent [Candidatus Methanomethylophilaceae archaeon]
MKIENWLGEDNQIGIDIWNKKYCYENETFDAWLDRVSAGNEDIREMMIQKKFLFGGRILANRGLNTKGIKVTLSNCYVVE